MLNRDNSEIKIHQHPFCMRCKLEKSEAAKGYPVSIASCIISMACKIAISVSVTADDCRLYWRINTPHNIRYSATRFLQSRAVGK